MYLEQSKNERGSVTIAFLGLFLVLSFFAGLVMDIGLFYYTRACLSKTADAAVLAGVAHLPGNAYGAEVLAFDYVELNGVARDAATVSITDSNRRIEVLLKKEVPFSIGQIFGLDSKVVSAKAAAVVGSVKALTGAVPFGVQQHNFEYGKQYLLKQGSGQAGSYKGNFGALGLGGHGATNYRNNLINGFPGEIEIGQIVPTEPGNMSGPTTQGINQRINLDPTATWEDYDQDSPRLIKVPIIQYVDKHGRSTAEVVGFAAFFLEGVGGSGHNNYVVGRFLKMMMSNKDGSIDESGTAGSDFGLYSYKLVI